MDTVGAVINDGASIRETMARDRQPRIVIGQMLSRAAGPVRPLDKTTNRTARHLTNKQRDLPCRPLRLNLRFISARARHACT